MVKRRAVLGTAGLALAGTLAGCSNIRELATEGELEVSASQATVDTPDEWGYTKVNEQQEEIEREEQGQTIRVTNWLTHYTKTLSVTIDGTQYAEPLGYVGVISTPEINLGPDLNPVAGETPHELQTTIKEEFGGEPKRILNAVNPEEERTKDDMPILGTDAIVTKYRGDPPWGELAIDNSLIEQFDPEIAFELSQAVYHGNDHIIAIGGYPQVPETIPGHTEINQTLQEQAQVLELFKNIVHPE